MRREALLFEWRWETGTCGLSQRPAEAGGSLSREVSARVGAAPTKPGCVSTARWRGSGEHGSRGVREELMVSTLSTLFRLGPGGSGPGVVHLQRIHIGELLWVGEARPRGGRAEDLRRRHGETAGAESGSSSIE